MTAPVNGLLAALADDPAAAAGLVDWLLQQEDPLATLARIQQRLQAVRSDLILRLQGVAPQALHAFLMKDLPAFFAESHASVRTRKLAERAGDKGIRTVLDLIGRTPHELFDQKHFGMTPLEEVREILHQHGLRLRNDTWEPPA